MKAKIIKPRNHDEWLAERMKGIGSSDIGIIAGVSHFMTPYQLWQLKRGIIQPQEETNAMECGHDFEDGVAQRFAIRTGRKIIKSSAGDWMFADKKLDFLRASPDRLFYYPDEAHTAKNRCILECKTTSLNIEPTIEGLMEKAPTWFCQVQWLMHVSGIHRASLAWRELTAGREFHYIDFTYNEPFGKRLETLAVGFWINNIINGEEPNVCGINDIKAKFSKAIEGKKAIADGNLNSRIEDLKNIKANIKKLEEVASTIEGYIRQEMADAEYLECNGEIIATCKMSKATERFDAKTFKAEHPDMYEQYTIQGEPSRRLVLK